MDTSDEDEQIQVILEEMDCDDVLLDMMLDDSSGHEELESNGWTGSREGKAPNKKRDFLAAYQKFTHLYFMGRESVCNEKDFERRFRVPREVFNRVHDKLMGEPPFIQYEDATGKLGVHPLVKLIACFRYMACGDAYDRQDENVNMCASTIRPIAKAFFKLIIKHFGKEYLNRAPTEAEKKSILSHNAGRKFPGMFGSWDCKHFAWKNCPSRLAGQMQGHHDGGKKTIIMEAVADFRKYLWYVNFGDAGSLNDLNALDKSSIVGAMLSGSLNLHVDPCVINGNDRDWMYFCVDGIYPEWATFVNTFSSKKDPDQKRFATEQEKVRKDVECAFGILVQRYHLLARPFRNWHMEDLKEVVDACTIMTKQEEESAIATAKSFPLFGRPRISAEDAAADGIDLFHARLAAFDLALQSSCEHCLLKQDLVEHIKSLATKT